MKRKTILINYMGRTNSGPLIALEIAKGLVKLGYNVDAVISKHVSNYNEWGKVGINKIYEVDTYQSSRELLTKSVKFCMIEYRKLKNFFINDQIDVVIKPMFHPWADLVCSLFRNAKIITYCHDPVMHSGVGKLNRVLYKKQIQHSDDVVVLTRSFIPIVVENYGINKKNVHFSPHGKLGTYREKQTVVCSDKAFQYDTLKMNFMFFGRIQEYKGLHVLAKAYEIVKKQYNNVTLTVIGSGDFSEYAEEYAALKDVTVVNRYIGDEEVGWCFIGKNLVTILPYTDATQSGVVPIAMEYGIPIIASNTGGLMEQLYDGEIGIFCPPSNAQALADQMIRFIVEPRIYTQQQKLMQTKMKELEWDVILANLMAELEENEYDK